MAQSPKKCIKVGDLLIATALLASGHVIVDDDGKWIKIEPVLGEIVIVTWVNDVFILAPRSFKFLIGSQFHEFTAYEDWIPFYLKLPGNGRTRCFRKQPTRDTNQLSSPWETGGKNSCSPA